MASPLQDQRDSLIGMELAITTLVAIIAGAVASIAGFGIGSLLTPLLASFFAQTKLAIVLVSIPHLLATATRCWLLRKQIDWQTLLHFGIPSAIGGLCGAWFAVSISNTLLSRIFGAILVFAGSVGLFRLNEKVRLNKPASWIAGAVSGGLGGLVGNQGGIRSAALLAFNLKKESFVATATATGVIVDLARMPVYFYSQHALIAQHWRLVICLGFGVLLGTALGVTYLRRIPESVFKQVVSALILALGCWMLIGSSV